LTRWCKAFLAPACLLAILAANVYVCRKLFFSEYTGHTNSIQGLWISMARLAGEHWYRPAWWPFHDGGMPFEHAYMPLVPGVTAVWAKLAGWSASRAFNAVTGMVYCLGPLTLFVLAWRMTGSALYSLWAALAYSLTSPARALIHDPNFNPAFLWTSRRLYTTVVWDDVPHGAAMCALPLAILFLWLSFERRRPVYYLLAGAASAAAVLASVFGAVAMALATVCLVAARPRERWWPDLRLAAAIGAGTYLAVCPFLPPTLIATMRANQQHFPEDRWSAGSLAALALVALGWVVLLLVSHRWIRDWRPRFFLLFAWLASAIPVLDAYLNLHFLPQAGRYQPEMELALPLAVVFLLRPAAEKLPRVMRVALALALLYLAARQVASHRRYAVEITRPADMRGRIEYQVAQWVDQNRPGPRVMVPGSIAQWFNVFSATPQLSGGSYSITPNWNQQEAMMSILSGAGGREAEVSILWLKAFGVHAVTVCGPRTTEFWKPYADPRKFEGRLSVLWSRDDTTIYRVPQRTASLAHVIPASAAARADARGNLPLAELEKYVAALDDPSLPEADLRFDGFRRASIRSTAHPGQAISVQTTWHPGWHARANGKTAEVVRDGLGFLLIRPRCDGPCTVELTYDGGWEYKLCRLIGALTILAALGYAAKWIRTS
jgi:hypothetical protein